MSDPALPSPRAWLEGWPLPWPPVAALPDGEPARACFCVIAVQLARTRDEQPYLRLTLSDRSGSIEARVWEGAEELTDSLRPGAYVGVQGRVEHYHGQPQLCVEEISLLHVQLEDLELFLPSSTRPPAAMNGELQAVIESVGDPGLRRLLEGLLGPDSEVGPGFRLAPAAKYNHHAFLGGLLEHTLSVTRICDRLADHYGPDIDRDLLVSAALLHDVGKVREIGARAGFPYTDEGKLLGHILLGLQMVNAAAVAVPELNPGRLLLLQHLIASHQGRYEWQSPREPVMLEGLILHYADDLDAKLQQVRQLLGQGQGTWTAWDRSFRREFLRHLPGGAGRAPHSEPHGEIASAVPEPAGPALGIPAPERHESPAETRGAAAADLRGREPDGRSASRGPGMCQDTLDLFASPEVD